MGNGNTLHDDAVKFLERDFNQSYQQLRHYDSQIFDILKFLFTAYTALVGVALGLYKFAIEKSVDLTTPAIGALAVGLLLGLFMFALLVRNRVYFVQVTRYINEQRKLFLDIKPHGFENVSKMYTNPKAPGYFNARSSHSWMFYIVATLNAILLGVLLYVKYPGDWCTAIVHPIALFIAQVGIAIGYLLCCEKDGIWK